jgi:hypothetical protein
VWTLARRGAVISAWLDDERASQLVMKRLAAPIEEREPEAAQEQDERKQ